MFSRLVSLFILLIVLSSVLPSASFPQSVSTEIYETEEDLLEGLEKGYLTFDQYLELLDMLQSRLPLETDESDKLYLIPDVSGVDVLKIQAQDQDIILGKKIGSFLQEKEKSSSRLISGRVVWKLQQAFREGGDAENYLLFEVAYGKRMIWRIEADHLSNSSQPISGNGTFRVRKRFFRILLPEYSGELVLGNFDKRIGLGLNVGYHPLLSYSDNSDYKTDDTFLYPVFGRYNGFCAESGAKSFRGLLLYSQNSFGGLEDRLGALDLSYLGDRIRLGFCYSTAALENITDKNKFKDDCSSFHLDLKLKPLNLSGEYALLSNKKSGVAFDLYSSRKYYSFDLSWWRYDDDFIHLHSGGISNPDYETIYLEEIDYRYRARQAGERGVFFKSNYKLSDRFSLVFSCSQWKERSYLGSKMRLKIGAGYRFSTKLVFMFHQLWSDYDLDDEITDKSTSTFDLSYSPHKNVNLTCLVNYRSTEAKDYGDIRLKIQTRGFSPLDLIVWLKYYDSDFSEKSDAYYSFHFQEKVKFSSNHFLSAEYIARFYQDGKKTDTKSARVRLEILW
jgi:hypothetical protein